MPLPADGEFLTANADDVKAAIAALAAADQRAFYTDTLSFAASASFSHSADAFLVLDTNTREVKAVASTPLADPNADRILFWDDSASAVAYLTIGTGLTVTGTTLDATGTSAPDASETVKGIIEIATNAETVTGSDTVRAVVPAGLTARLAAPGAIGGTTPAAGSFTTVDASGAISGASLAVTGAVELGHASDTTLARVSAGVVSIEGVNVVTVSATQTLTNKTLTSPALTTPDIGTPSAGTLTNCTGLPLAGVVDSTSEALGVGTLEVGHASDTTISRSAAGVIAVEGVPLFPGLPQNSQSAAYTTVLADAQKHILHPSADTTARVFTIDSNANVPYPIGTAITFINQASAGTLTIAITSDTMRLAGAGSTGSRTLTANGIATAIKITSTEWIISGTNLT